MVNFEFDVELYREALIEQGRAEGFAEGFAKGFAEGFAEGREEVITEVVKNMMKAGTPIEYIIKATGWTEEKILSLTEK